MTDEPKYSSAALCLRFSIQGKTSFRPEFTHQCFDGEFIRGYQPLWDVVQQARQELLNGCGDADPCRSIDNDSSSSLVLLHPSHHRRHHHHNHHHTKELEVLVELSPSCEQASISLKIQAKRKVPTVRSSSRQLTKRRKEEGETTIDDDHLEKEEDDEEEFFDDENTDDNGQEEEESEYEMSGEDDEEEQDPEQPEGTTRKRRMPPSELIERAGRALPSIIVQQKKKDEVSSHFLSEPIGKILQEFHFTKRQNKDNSMDFVICLADGSDPKVAAYHRQVQRLAIWFIETADSVDIASTDSGYWKVLYLFQKNSSAKYSLAGYMTLFHFHAPFHKPRGGTIVRICQALLLPPYQRQGHGKRLMKAVYEMAQASKSDVVQINVEDPAPGFVALRNRVDLEWMQQHAQEWNYVGSTRSSDPLRNEFWTARSDDELQELSTKSKIIPRQIQLVDELVKLQAIRTIDDAGSKETQDELEKKFRLLVKKRLNKEHREEMSALSTKTAKQNFLSDRFDEELGRYENLLGLSATM